MPVCIFMHFHIASPAVNSYFAAATFNHHAEGRHVKDTTGTVVGTANAEHYRWGEGCDGWHLVNQENLSVIQERVPPGTGERKHYHAKARQFFYVLEGTATLECDGRVLAVNPREGLEIPPSVPHLLRNDFNVDLVFLIISSPRSHGDRVNV